MSALLEILKRYIRVGYENEIRGIEAAYSTSLWELPGACQEPIRSL
jgi:hypothetical protein